MEEGIERGQDSSHADSKSRGKKQRVHASYPDGQGQNEARHDKYEHSKQNHWQRQPPGHGNTTLNDLGMKTDKEASAFKTT
jgi:hypothetical protein